MAKASRKRGNAVAQDTLFMLADEPASRMCGHCGASLAPTNKSSYCTRTRGCKTANNRANVKRKRQQEKCSRPTCKEPAASVGLCEMHYARLRRMGDVGPDGRLTTPVSIWSGDTFGLWTVIEGVRPGEAYVLCRCVCGIERGVLTHSLKQGLSHSCGCRGTGRSPARAPSAPYLRAGATFGRLTLLADVARGADMGLWACACGNQTRAIVKNVRSGNTRSCGCIVREGSTHGLSAHPLFQTWRGIIRRTTDPRDRRYPSYGGRGIGVTERWVGIPGGFLNFLEDVGPRPEGMSLDRIDNDRGYEPGNVRWADHQQQMLNRRSVAKLTRERDALLTRVAELEGMLAAQVSRTV